MRLEGSDPVRYVEEKLERDPSLWENTLSRQRLVQNALLVGIGGTALVNAAGAAAAPRSAAQRAAAAAPRTTLVAAQRVAAPTLNPDVAGYRSEIILSCYPGLVQLDIPGDYDEAKKQLATKGLTIL